MTLDFTLLILPFPSALIMVTQNLPYFESVQEGVIAIFKFYLAVSLGGLEGSPGVGPTQTQIQPTASQKYTPFLHYNKKSSLLTRRGRAAQGPVDGSLHSSPSATKY